MVCVIANNLKITAGKYILKLVSRFDYIDKKTCDDKQREAIVQCIA